MKQDNITFIQFVSQDANAEKGTNLGIKTLNQKKYTTLKDAKKV